MTVDIQTATSPTSVLRTLVGRTDGSGDFDLDPTQSTKTLTTIVPRPSSAPITLPDGRYRATLKVLGVAQSVVFFTVTSYNQPAGRSLFSTPFAIPTTASNPTPEQTLFGAGATFTLSRYNPLRLPTDLDYAKFSAGPGVGLGARMDAQARFNPVAPDGLPFTYSQLAPTASIAPIGIGYWLDIDQTVNLTPTGSPLTSPVSIRLFAGNGGWNLIGAPVYVPCELGDGDRGC